MGGTSFGTRISSFLQLAGPFALTQVLYWYVWFVPENQPSFRAALVKCLPLLSLLSFAVSAEAPKQDKKKQRFVNLMSAAFAFSMLGDGIMVYQRFFFAYGVAAFAGAQASFVAAFGFLPLRPGLFIAIGAPMAIYGLFVLQSVSDLALCVFLTLYSSLLCCMAWRAVAFASSERSSHCLLPSWLPGIGSILFLISDSVIVFNKFHRRIDFAQHIIMSTYFAGQFLLATSLVGVSSERDAKDKRTEKKTK